MKKIFVLVSFALPNKKLPFNPVFKEKQILTVSSLVIGLTQGQATEPRYEFFVLTNIQTRPTGPTALC